MRTTKRIRGLYAVTPELRDDARLFDLAEQALRGGASVLQYRDKETNARIVRTRASRLRDLCVKHDAIFIVNDDPRLAADVAAHGVHLGREDVDVDSARAMLGPRAIIGVSCYDRLVLAQEARARGVDYVAFGSMFSSSVKPGAVRASLALLTRARREIELPIVAIGGIDLDNAASVLRAGADALAVITALFSAPDVQARAREFTALMLSTTSFEPNQSPHSI